MSKFVKKLKKKIINTLHWLIFNYLLHKIIKIKYCLFNIFDDKFILFGIIYKIFNCNLNYYKYLDYIANISKNIYKNSFYVTITNTSIKKDYIYDNCIYNNINNRKQNQTLSLLSVIGNIEITNLCLN